MLRAFFLTVLAGGATLAGGLSIFFLRRHGRRVVCASLGFAAGAMLYVVVEELIPEAHLGDHSNVGSLSVMIGFLAMMILDIALG